LCSGTAALNCISSGRPSPSWSISAVSTQAGRAWLWSRRLKRSSLLQNKCSPDELDDWLASRTKNSPPNVTTDRCKANVDECLHQFPYFSTMTSGNSTAKVDESEWKQNAAEQTLARRTTRTGSSWTSTVIVVELNFPTIFSRSANFFKHFRRWTVGCCSVDRRQ
ncbi:hypothetical protein T4B_14631, partial [Trichinella pseudospiralis]